MAVTIKQSEAAPAAYPAAPAGLSTAAAALVTVAWQRLDSYVAHRWSARDVVWTVEGPGEWAPPLSPATVAAVEIWTDGEWSDVTPDESPLGGYWLPASGPYRFTGTVGGGTVPAAVNEAVRRLAEYFAAKPGEAGAASERWTVSDVESRQVDRSPSWLARAIQNSGAGDLLRPYRRI